MWRISPISDDWVVKGFHLHRDEVELAMRPDHRGAIIFRKVFSSTPDRDAEAVIKGAEDLLEDPAWRDRFREALGRAMDYLIGFEGVLRPLARGRLAEFHFLRVALDKMEPKRDGDH